jgi:ATP-binding cassette subfamily B protein
VPNLTNEIWSVLTPGQRRWVLAAQLLSILMAFSTVSGIAAIAPDLRRARTEIHTTPASVLRTDCAWPLRPQQEIRLEEVSFRYAADQPWALRGVSLRVPARAAVGIVGVNGSGKTTLVDVVVGLLAPSDRSGRLT